MPSFRPGAKDTLAKASQTINRSAHGDRNCRKAQVSGELKGLSFAEVIVAAGLMKG